MHGLCSKDSGNKQYNGLDRENTSRHSQKIPHSNEEDSCLNKIFPKRKGKVRSDKKLRKSFLNTSFNTAKMALNAGESRTNRWKKSPEYDLFIRTYKEAHPEMSRKTVKREATKAFTEQGGSIWIATQELEDDLKKIRDAEAERKDNYTEALKTGVNSVAKNACEQAIVFQKKRIAQRAKDEKQTVPEPVVEVVEPTTKPTALPSRTQLIFATVNRIEETYGPGSKAKSLYLKHCMSTKCKEVLDFAAFAKHLLSNADVTTVRGDVPVRPGVITNTQQLVEAEA